MENVNAIAPLIPDHEISVIAFYLQEPLHSDSAATARFTNSSIDSIYRHMEGILMHLYRRLINIVF